MFYVGRCCFEFVNVIGEYYADIDFSLTYQMQGVKFFLGMLFGLCMHAAARSAYLDLVFVAVVVIYW